MQAVVDSFPDMHEALLTRNDVRGRPHLLVRIMVPENCALLHHKCHTEGSSTSLREVVLKYLLDVEGPSTIIRWLESMRVDFKSDLIDERIREVKEHSNDEEI